MANGDVAAAQGFTPVAPSKDIRLGYDDINRLADWVASRTIGRRIAASGRVTPDVSGSGSLYTADVTVTLPAGRFTSTPRVTVTPLSGTNEDMGATTQNITATSFGIHFHRTTNTSTGLDWVAVENG